MFLNKNFKSFDKSIKSAKDLYAKIGFALEHQNKCICNAMLYEIEKEEEKEKELEEFKIKLENIDRIYYIFTDENTVQSNYYLLARLDNQNLFRYVELIYYHNKDYAPKSVGTIFFCSDIYTFVKIVLPLLRSKKKDYIYNSIIKDTIHFEKEKEKEEEEEGEERYFEELDKWDEEKEKRKNQPIKTIINPHTLKFFCLEVISSKKNLILIAKDILPKILINNLEDFIINIEKIEYNKHIRKPIRIEKIQEDYEINFLDNKTKYQKRVTNFYCDRSFKWMMSQFFK